MVDLYPAEQVRSFQGPLLMVTDKPLELADDVCAYCFEANIAP